MKKLEHYSSANSAASVNPSYSEITGNKPIEVNIAPVDYRLYQNFPQTFYKVTRVCFDLPKDTKVKLGVYDVFGREICILIDDVLHSGSYEVVFDASHFNLGPGILMYKLKTDEFADTKKMFLLKNNITLS